MDKRSSFITLTHKVSDKLDDARAMFQGNDEALSDFTEREIATLNRLLKRVVSHLESADESLGMFVKT
ncbi:hypothetical protein ACOBR2_15535 [Telmatobacter bradus]|uniref:hypothetical protein n=1 Tax=Telmatobacter bradus TaxID=474953 RepID=UPI003B439606